MSDPGVYDNLIATSLRSIKRFGRVATIIPQESSSAGNFYDPQVQDGSPLTVDIAFVRHQQDTIDGTLIQVGDTRGLLAATSLPDGVIPKTGWKVTDGSTNWKIPPDGVTIITPGNDPVLYILNLRR